jgi:hypothetical protein
MTVADGASAQGGEAARQSNFLVRWWRRRSAAERKVDYAVWDLRERYGEAACGIAWASARAPAGFERRRFWRKVARKLQRLE